MYGNISAPGPSRRGSRPRPAAAAALCALSLAVAGCSGGGGSGSQTSNQLTLQFPGPPVSLDPAKAGNGGSTVFVSLAYDPLIYLSGKGDMEPDLATKWGFTDHANK